MMKTKLKLFLTLAIGIALTYTACKKSSTTPADPTLTPSQVASQVAVTVSGSLFGGLGAFDVSGGVSAPASLSVHTQGKTLDDLTNPTCGSTVDTTLSFTGTTNGGSASISGSIKFSFACTNDVISGYTTDDNVTIVLTSTGLDLNYKVGEDFTLSAITPTSLTSNLSLTGSLTSNGSYTVTTGNKGTGTEVFNYTLTSLVIDPSVPDIISGTASFNTSGTGPKGVWSYSGTIVFTGNQMATVTISGKVYTVNLQTGVVG